MRLTKVKYPRVLARVERDINAIIAALNENRLASGLGYRLKRTAHGTGLELIGGEQVESGDTSGGTRMQIVSVEGDYLTARKESEAGTIDNASTLYYVAKPHFLRVSVLNLLTIDSWRIAITSPGNSRTLTALSGAGVTAGLSVTQRLNYPYEVGNTIYAEKPEGKTAVNHPVTSGQKLEWLDKNCDARCFHQTRIMLNACVVIAGVPTTKLIVFEAGPVP